MPTADLEGIRSFGARSYAHVPCFCCCCCAIICCCAMSCGSMKTTLLLFAFCCASARPRCLAANPKRPTSSLAFVVVVVGSCGLSRQTGAGGERDCGAEDAAEAAGADGERGSAELGRDRC